MQSSGLMLIKGRVRNQNYSKCTIWKSVWRLSYHATCWRL